MSWLILKRGGSTPVLANHKKGIFRLKRAFLGESQRMVSQLSSFRLETHFFFFFFFFLDIRATNLCYTIEFTDF